MGLNPLLKSIITQLSGLIWEKIKLVPYKIIRNRVPFNYSIKLQKTH